MTRTFSYVQSLFATLRENEAGQTMAEYAVVLGVITAAIVAAIALLSGSITNSLSSTSGRL